MSRARSGPKASNGTCSNPSSSAAHHPCMNYSACKAAHRTREVDEEPVIPHSNDLFRIEVRGFDHIPESERNMSLRQIDGLWVGTSVNLLSFALGALAITVGL